ncbi:MAG: HAMP domain-containing histidine kinase [Prevotellaceae bacterium]|nr:HAMP domain-containing histidine kinase [Prevotellaceae bacterium]
MLKKFGFEFYRQAAGSHETLRYIYIGGLFAAGVLIALFIYVVTLRNCRNRDLAEMNATKDRFFSIISHDLKNPVLAQRDALQLLTKEAENWNTELLSKYYRELLKSADGQVELLYNLLNWAQVQTGRMPYLPARFDLISALQSDLSLVKNIAERKGIKFKLHISKSAILTGDENMITAVVRNLLPLAVNFTARGGTVTLDIPPPFNPPKGGKALVFPAYAISVSDTGIGITDEQLQNLFRIDRQHSRKGTAGESGSGLGLVVCKELVEKHGSRLQVEGAEGQGSKFWFELGK